MFSTSIIQYGVVIAFVCALVLVGWTARGWYEDKRELAIQTFANTVSTKLITKESIVARAVEDKLSNINVTREVIEHDRVKIVQSNPVYHITCMDDAGMQLILDLKQKYSDTRNPPDALRGLIKNASTGK